jgi:hypothetical protein
MQCFYFGAIIDFNTNVKPNIIKGGSQIFKSIVVIDTLIAPIYIQIGFGLEVKLMLTTPHQYENLFQNIDILIQPTKF